MLEDDDEDDEFEFTGFFWPTRIVFDTWYAYRQYGVLPFAGGLLDQPQEWWQDIKILQAVYNRAIAEHRRKHSPDDKDQW